MKREERHLIRSKERIEILETRLEQALSFCSPKDISRKGYKITVKTELTPRDPKEEKLEIEVVFDVDLVGILTCPDGVLMDIIKETCFDSVEFVKQKILRDAVSKYFYCYF